MNNVVTDETRRGFNAAQYMEGFDACTREVSDCLQSQNITISPELYAGLLSHLAVSRRRLLLARSRDDQCHTVLPPTECLRLCSDSLDENTSCVHTSKLARQTRAVTGEDNRSPLLSIANLQPVALPAAEASLRTKSQLSCSERRPGSQPLEHECGMNALQSDINHSQRVESCTSHDDMSETECDGNLSLATHDDVTSSMWRPW